MVHQRRSVRMSVRLNVMLVFFFPTCNVIVDFFFFSSRRRHTIFDCDWSSDVCSSDLNGRQRILPVERQTGLAVHCAIMPPPTPTLPHKGGGRLEVAWAPGRPVGGEHGIGSRHPSPVPPPHPPRVPEGAKTVSAPRDRGEG